MVTKTYAVIIAIVLIISIGVRFTLISRLSEAKNKREISSLCLSVAEKQ